MGKKVVLAPRNSAEAVALGVSACFLAVAGVVVHGNASVERSEASNGTVYAAQVQVPRTHSRPSSNYTVSGSRVPVLTAEPPLVLLPVERQAEAKLAAQGTQRGEGVILVASSRGAATLSGGGGLSGIIAGPQTSPTDLGGAVGFPASTVASGSSAITVTTAPTTSPTSSPTTPPTTSPTTPPTTSPTTPPTTTPPTTTPPTTTPPTEPTDPPTEPGSGTGDGGSTDSGSTTGATTGSTTGSESSTAGETTSTSTSGPSPSPAPTDPTPESGDA